MRDQMIHRGPDASGIWIDKELRIGLAHRRLAIIDLSKEARQPMCSIDQTIQVVFNGEIYNHEQIRSELKDLGYKDWITDHSDTEVILKAFQEWGINCVKKFHGMFAIALWDSKKQDLWLIRDRIGIKPLYYAISEKKIVFASEIKAILSDPSFPRKVNEEA
ncbi:MAG: asparagine synthetase B, partial [Rhodospirillaceae bacterium]|nr:asparagine synthetase B [Rhodospirillaceae bacterium]